MKERARGGGGVNICFMPIDIQHVYIKLKSYHPVLHEERYTDDGGGGGMEVLKPGVISIRKKRNRKNAFEAIKMQNQKERNEKNDETKEEIRGG
jgi:hypothetical protein